MCDKTIWFSQPDQLILLGFTNHTSNTHLGHPRFSVGEHYKNMDVSTQLVGGKTIPQHKPEQTKGDPGLH